MRKRLGNITSSPRKKIEQDADHEALRRVAVTEHRIRRAKSQAQGHLDEMTGKREASEAVLKLFDDRGNPPPHFTYGDLLRQYKRLRAQQIWLSAIREEMEDKMRALDPVRYARDQAERDAAAEEIRQKKESVRAEYLEDSENQTRPWLRQVMRDALQALYRAKEYNIIARRSVTDMRICSLRQIETALRNLFAEFVTNPALKVSMDPSVRYNVLRRESDWAAVTILDIDTKLLGLNEILDSGKIYLDGV